MNENCNFWFWLDVVSNLAQLESYRILLEDYDNNDLMKYLNHQDVLLSKIIEQNEQILELLKKNWGD